MAKTTRSSTAAKAQKGKSPTGSRGARSKPAAGRERPVKSAAKAAPKKAVAKPVAAKKPAAKPVAGKAAAKSPAKKSVVKKVTVKKSAMKNAPAKKAVAKKPAVKKAVAKKPALKKPAVKKVVAKKPAVTNARPGSGAAVKKAAKPATKVVAKKAVPAKPVAKPAAKPATRPNPPAEPAAKSVAKPAAVAVNHVSPAPASTLFKGKVASATAMVIPRATQGAAGHAPPHKSPKNSSSSMNKSAATKLDNGITREDGRYALPSTSIINLPKGYHPSLAEEYMNPMHLAYFRNKLRDWRDQLVEESRQTMDNLREEVRDVGDEAERATRETENSLELRTRDRYRKLISKIDKALRRIEEGSYGFCEETDEEIGIDRLDARPIATLSLDAQERREHLQKQMGD